MSQANKDEALRCLEISKTKFSEGHSEAALKFAKKSTALCETPEATAWLEFLSKHSANGSSNSSSASEGVRRRPTASTSTASSPTSSAPLEEPESRPYTPEQAQGVQRIKSCKAKGDLYAILGLEKGCSDSDIKKAYKKLALQFHPDKCAAPGTDDAFKAIGHAMAVLSDTDKRDKYDRYGIDSESRASTSSASAPFSRGFSADFGDEISPEDLFNMFFGEMATGGATFTTAGPGFRFHTNASRFHRANQRAGGPNQQQQTRTAQFVQLLPLIFLFLVTILSWFTMDPEPLFTFSPQTQYNSERHTAKMNVRYYVNKRMFIQQGYEGGRNNEYRLRQFENAVESKWLSDLENQCHQEYQQRAMQIQAARGLFSVDEARLKAAKARRLYKCEERQEFLDRLTKINRGM